MRSTLVLLALVSTVAAQRPPARDCSKLFDGQAVIFADMHDGDEKIVSIQSSGSILQIEPWNSTDVWKVTAPIRTTDCTAMVNFDVPGKPSPPPVSLMASLAEFGSANKRALITFTDPSGTLKPGKPYYPLNAWVAAAYTNTE